MGTPDLIWHEGTAYDFFASIYVVFNPVTFGLRNSWAAGVRYRLPQGSRDFFGSILPTFVVPLHWICTLPEPRDADHVLDTIEGSDDERLLRLLGTNPKVFMHDPGLIAEIERTGRWSDNHVKSILKVFRDDNLPTTRKDVEILCGYIADASLFGKKLKRGLKDYFEVFFKEEEIRIKRTIHSQLVNAERLEDKLPTSELMATITHGVNYKEWETAKTLILAPSYWCTPLMMYSELSETSGIVLFGARPKDVSLVPGEVIPDSLFHSLESLADNTRLRILRLLSQKPMTQTELARHLRLRTPTITHHLKKLRLAELIYLKSDESHLKEYTIHIETIRDIFGDLKNFIFNGKMLDQPAP